jgi:hypothetical protein
MRAQKPRCQETLRQVSSGVEMKLAKLIFDEKPHHITR